MVNVRKETRTHVRGDAEETSPSGRGIDRMKRKNGNSREGEEDHRNKKSGNKLSSCKDEAPKERKKELASLGVGFTEKDSEELREGQRTEFRPGDATARF